MNGILTVIAKGLRVLSLSGVNVLIRMFPRGLLAFTPATAEIPPNSKHIL